MASHYYYLASDIAIINNMWRTLPTLLLLHPLLILLLREILGLPGVTAASSSSNSDSTYNSYCEAEDTGKKILKTSYVSNVEQAAQLAQDLLSCPGEEFLVEWNGAIVINQSLEIANRSSLTITGQGQQQGRATIEAGDITGPTFVVRESSLQLDGLTITGASGTDGGVVAALDGASVSFFDCNISGNTVSSNGGRWERRTTAVVTRARRMKIMVVI